MKIRLAALAWIVGVLVALATLTAPARAHHSFAAEFDRSKPVTVKGVITRLQWQNPHIWYFVDVKDEATGKVTNWGFSGGPPGLLTRRGVRKENLAPGTVVIVTGFRAKDGSNNASGGRVTYEDGRNALTGAAEDAIPPAGGGRGQ